MKKPLIILGPGGEYAKPYLWTKDSDGELLAPVDCEPRGLALWVRRVVDWIGGM